MVELLKEQGDAYGPNNCQWDREASSHSVDETVERLKAILQVKGAVLFGWWITAKRQKSGTKDETDEIVGNPKAGTPLMLASPSTAIDLPLKILVWEDAAKKVWISYKSPEYS